MEQIVVKRRSKAQKVEIKQNANSLQKWLSADKNRAKVGLYTRAPDNFSGVSRSE